MKEKIQFDIGELSEHLFWDVDRNTLDIHKNFNFVLQRTLSYGLASRLDFTVQSIWPEKDCG